MHTCMMFLAHTTLSGVIPKRLELFILKSSLIKVKESKDASHQQEKRPYRRSHFPTRSAPDHLHPWLFSPGSVCEGLGCSMPRGSPGPSFSAVSLGDGGSSAAAPPARGWALQLCHCPGSELGHLVLCSHTHTHRHVRMWTASPAHRKRSC